MKIPRYIFICDTQDDTKRAFERIFEKGDETRLFLVTSSSSNKGIEWLFEFLEAGNVDIDQVDVDKDDTEAIEKTIDRINKSCSNICIGIGGGRVLDVAKFVSFSSHIPFISFPTLLSHDGIASPVAVIRNGKCWSESRTVASPYAVIIDLPTVAAAPPVSLLSGISDLTANLFASLDAELFSDMQDSEYDSLATAIARSASQLVFPRFQEVSIHAIPKEAVKHLAWGLVLSGIAMSIGGNSRPASGAEHKISHAIDYLFPASVSHGFTVSVGNVVSAFLHERYQEDLVSFNTSLGLPVLSDEIGIEKENFVEVIRYASKIRPDRHTILEERNLTRGEIAELLDQIQSVKEAMAKSS